jgi:protein-tyrosine kinase
MAALWQNYCLSYERVSSAALKRLVYNNANRGMRERSRWPAYGMGSNQRGISVSIIEKAVGKLDQKKAHAAMNEALPADVAQSLPERVAAVAKANTTALPPVESSAAYDTHIAAPEIAAGNGFIAPPQLAETPAVASTLQEESTVKPERPPAKKVMIDLARLGAVSNASSEGGRNPVAEEFRAIKRPLIDNAFSKDGRSVNRNNLIMVTSALPGEGKTFSAINLAMELDHTVLLIDADVARPSVLRTLGLKPEAGLMDVLLDPQLDVSDVLLKTNIDTLSILPSGRSHRHATELLASQTMSKLLDEIASRYPDRLVIFDSPPLLLTSEASVLASQMGQIVVVVEAETTSMHAVKSALSKLEGCSNVNLVYNKARNFPGQANYGYYYT